MPLIKYPSSGGRVGLPANGSKPSIAHGFTVRETTPEEDAFIGGDWKGIKWAGVAIVRETVRPTLAPITARQLRLWLLSQGVQDANVVAEIEKIEDIKQREAARIEWEYATEYRREHPLVAQLGAALGLCEAQIDAAFVAAAKL